MSDILISVAIGILTLLISAMGVRVSMRPIAHGDTRRLRKYEVSFTFCGIAVALLLVWQGVKGKQAQEALNRALASIQQNTSKPPQVNNYLPEPKVVFEPSPAAPVVKRAPPSISWDARKRLGTINEVQAFVTAKGDLQNPAFRVVCDVPCTFNQGQYLGGATQFEPYSEALATTVEGHFIIPAVMKNGEQAILGLRSESGQSVNVLSVKLIKARGGTR